MDRAEKELARVSGRTLPRRSERSQPTTYAMSSSSSDTENTTDATDTETITKSPPRPSLSKPVTSKPSASESSSFTFSKMDIDPAILSKQKPMLAMSQGDPNRPIVVPRVALGILIVDVDTFIHHFSVMKGLSKEKGNTEEAETAVIAVLTKWNSPYTVNQDERPEASKEMGSQAGRNLAYRCVVKKMSNLLQPLFEYFNTQTIRAAKDLRNMTEADMKDYEEYGAISWYYLCLMEHHFMEASRDAIVEVARTTGKALQEASRQTKIEVHMEVAATKAIENHGGIVFGSGGGARGGFDFVGKGQWDAGFTFGTPKAENDQMGGLAGGSQGSIGIGQERNTFGLGGMKTAIGDIGADNAGAQRFSSGKEAGKQAETEHTSKRWKDVDGKAIEVGQRASHYDFMGEVQMDDEYSSARANGPPEGIGGDFFDGMV